MNIDLRWKIKIVDVGWKLERDVYIFRKGINGRTEVLQPDGTIQSFEEGSSMDYNPFLSMDNEMMQAFADELSNKGIKPQQGFTDGKLEATQKHLDDMRTLLKLK